jgi:cytochrome c oxidase subunit 1
MAIGVVLFLFDALGLGVRATDTAAASANPWGAGTLEWATSSPPRPGNFLHAPTAGGREPLWENPPHQPVVTGLRTDIREVLVTHVLDAEPDHRQKFPDPSPWPLLTAITTTALFVGSIFTPWAVVWGAIPVFITMVGWFWPRSADDGGTQPWPVRTRSLPRPGEAPAAGGAL